MHRAGVILGATENIRYIVMLLWVRFAFLSYFKINIINSITKIIIKITHSFGCPYGWTAPLEFAYSVYAMGQTY